MFSLIIVIFSIALAVALVALSMYHGGDVLNKGRLEARAAQAVAEVQQINGAVTAYKAREGKAPDGMVALTGGPDGTGDKYLSSAIDGWGVAAPVVNLTAFEVSQLTGTEAENLSVCQSVNQKLGVSGVPECSTVTGKFSGCCVVN